MLVNNNCCLKSMNCESVKHLKCYLFVLKERYIRIRITRTLIRRIRRTVIKKKINNNKNNNKNNKSN